MGQGDNVKSFKPEIVLLFCERCTAREPSSVSSFTDTGNISVRMDMLPCSSKVDVSHLLKIVEQGADGVEVVCCPVGACQCIDGNVREGKRVEYARGLLGQIGMGADRLGITHGAALSRGDLAGIAEKRAQAVGPLGVNPMKGKDAQ